MNEVPSIVEVDTGGITDLFKLPLGRMGKAGMVELVPVLAAGLEKVKLTVFIVTGPVSDVIIEVDSEAVLRVPSS